MKHRKNILLLIIPAMLLLSSCGAGATNNEFTANDGFAARHEYDMGNGVMCYTVGNSAISCVQHVK